MKLSSRLSNPETFATAALIAAIVVAPLAGGSSRIEVLPVLFVLGSVAFVLELLCCRRDRRSLHVPELSLIFVVLAAVTLAQAIPLPPSLLGILSPKAAEIRAFVLDAPGSAPVSYELSATLREALKLVLYAVIAVAAANRSRALRGPYWVTGTVVVAGMAAAGLAVIHRLLGAERVLGVVESALPASQLLTTFANPNHSAGFMVLTALTAVGLALEAERRSVRVGLLLAAAISASVCIASLSRGGIGALVLGVLVLIGLLLRVRTTEARSFSRALPALAVLGLLPIAVFAARFDAISAEVFAPGKNEVLGISEKLAAVQDAIPMIQEHPWFGVGRGAYVSIYPHYKTTWLQLTFAFPENLFAQLLSEWGVIVGALALIAMAWVMFTRIRAVTSPATAGALAGIIALAIQNLVDFSFELPGVAIPVVALLASAAGGKRWRIELPSRFAVGATAAAPVVMASALLILVFATGDLGRDLSWLESVSIERSKAQGSEARQTPKRAFEVAREHPANALIATRVSYLNETNRPPDLLAATRWMNKALYLAPTYADGHLAAGRMLARAGYRKQAMESFRRAWELSGEKNRIIDQVIRTATTADEVLEAVPRRDIAFDIPSELDLARAVTRLVSTNKAELARALLERADPALDGLSEQALKAIGSAAIQSRSWSIADRSTQRLVAEHPSAAVHLLRAQAARGMDDKAEVRRALERASSQPDVDRVPILRMQIDLAVQEGRLDEARQLVEALRTSASPTYEVQADILALAARVEVRAGRPGAAVDRLGEAIRLAPANLDLRLRRAESLLSLGRTSEAKTDLELVLSREPDHALAKRLQQRVSTGKL